MAYRLTYWESADTPDTHYEIRVIRLKSVEEIFPLSLQHNRPSRCSLITLDRTDNQSTAEVIIWEKGMEYPSSLSQARKENRLIAKATEILTSLASKDKKK